MPASCAARTAPMVRRLTVPSGRSSVPSRSVATNRTGGSSPRRQPSIATFPSTTRRGYSREASSVATACETGAKPKGLSAPDGRAWSHLRLLGRLRQRAHERFNHLPVYAGAAGYTVPGAPPGKLRVRTGPVRTLRHHSPRGKRSVVPFSIRFALVRPVGHGQPIAPPCAAGFEHLIDRGHSFG